MIEINDKLEFIIKIFAIIASLAAFVIFLSKKWKAYVAKRNKFFARNWSNEGVIGSPKLSHYIDIEVSATGSEISGSSNIRESGSDHTWHYVSFHGKIRFSMAYCSIIHVREGRVIPFGNFKLKRQKGSLLWISSTANPDFFPRKTELFPSLPVII